MAEVAKDSYDRGDVSALPVERLGPQPATNRGETHEPEVVAIADDGTEIVYVGEAAQDRTVASRHSFASARASSAELATPRRSPTKPLNQSADRAHGTNV